MSQDKTIVDVLKSGQIVAWQEHEEGADTYVSIITWNESLTLNLWQGLAGDGSFQKLDCKTMQDPGLSRVSVFARQEDAKRTAEKWLEEIQAAEEEELNGAPFGLDQEGEQYIRDKDLDDSAQEWVDEQIAKSDAGERNPVIADLWDEPVHPAD